LDEICVLCGYERKYASKLLGGRRPIAGESGKCRGGSQRIYAAADFFSAPIAISKRLPATGERNSEERNQGTPHRVETISEAIPSEQRERMEMGNLVNSFTMIKISIN